MLTNTQLIAEFMGYKLTKERHSHRNVVWLAGGHQMVYSGEDFFCDEASYDPERNWNYLMPVIQRIETIEDGRFVVTLERAYCVISDNGESPIVEVQHEPTDPKIGVALEAVVKFIKWYNSESKHP